MRVLLSADAVGGVWDYAATLANGLAAGGHSVLLACVGRPTAELRVTLDPAIRVEWAEHRLEWMAERDEEIAAAAAWLRSLAEAWGADLVHLNQLAYSAQAFGAPTLVVAHSDVLSWFGEVRGAGAPPEWARYARWVRDGLAGATAVVAVSRYQSELLARHHGTGADRVIHNGAAAPPHSPPPLRSPVVISAGRAWDEAKGAVVLDRALAHLGADAPETHLFGALEGPAGQRFTPGRVAAHGRTPRGELERWMERAEIFVSASLYEPFGLAPLEAAQRGCALLLSDIGSYRELWEGCAAFFPAGDASALAEALRSLRGDPERLQALAAAARERATTRYTAARMVTDYLALYGELVDAGAAAPVAAEPLSSGI